MEVKYSGNVGSSVRRYCDAHANQVQECDYGEGYCTDSGRAYDVLLRAGWRMGDDFCHTLIEQTAAQILAQLRAVVPCNCEECKERAQ